jgi:hypothetical protein
MPHWPTATTRRSPAAVATPGTTSAAAAVLRNVRRSTLADELS